MSEGEMKQTKTAKSAARKHWSRIWRITIGTMLLLLGIALLVLPGPGIVVMIAGLAVMAPEVPIAYRAMQPLKKKARDAEQKVRRARENRRK